MTQLLNSYPFILRKENQGSYEDTWMLPAAFFVITKTESHPKRIHRWLERQMEMRPHHRTLLSSEEEWTTDTRNNTVGPRNSYAEWQKPEEQCTYCVISFSYTSRKYKEIYSDKLQIGGCLVRGVQGGDRRRGLRGATWGWWFQRFIYTSKLIKGHIPGSAYQ